MLTLPEHLYGESLTPSVTIFGYRTIEEIMKLKEVVRVGPLSNAVSVLRR